LDVTSTLVQRAGVPLPPAYWKAKTWTMADFEQTARSLTRSTGDAPTWGYFNMTAMKMISGFVASNGGSILNKDATAIALTEPPAVEAFQWLQDLVFKLRVAPTQKEGSDAGGF